MSEEYSEALEDVARSFVQAGLYDSKEAFLRDLAKDFTQHKIQSYHRVIRRYERKYGTWERFGEEIKGRATPKQEDEWMEWEAAVNMLKAWKELAKELGLGAS